MLDAYKLNSKAILLFNELHDIVINYNKLIEIKKEELHNIETENQIKQDLHSQLQSDIKKILKSKLHKPEKILKESLGQVDSNPPPANSLSSPPSPTSPLSPNIFSFGPQRSIQTKSVFTQCELLAHNSPQKVQQNQSQSSYYDPISIHNLPSSSYSNFTSNNPFDTFIHQNVKTKIKNYEHEIPSNLNPTSRNNSHQSDSAGGRPVVASRNQNKQKLHKNTSFGILPENLPQETVRKRALSFQQQAGKTSKSKQLQTQPRDCFGSVSDRENVSVNQKYIVTKKQALPHKKQQLSSARISRQSESNSSSNSNSSSSDSSDSESDSSELDSSQAQDEKIVTKPSRKSSRASVSSRRKPGSSRRATRDSDFSDHLKLPVKPNRKHKRQSSYVNEINFINNFKQKNQAKSDDEISERCASPNAPNDNGYVPLKVEKEDPSIISPTLPRHENLPSHLEDISDPEEDDPIDHDELEEIIVDEIPVQHDDSTEFNHQVIENLHAKYGKHESEKAAITIQLRYRQYKLRQTYKTIRNSSRPRLIVDNDNKTVEINPNKRSRSHKTARNLTQDSILGNLPMQHTLNLELEPEIPSFTDNTWKRTNSSSIPPNINEDGTLSVNLSERLENSQKVETWDPNPNSELPDLDTAVLASATTEEPENSQNSQNLDLDSDSIMETEDSCRKATLQPGNLVSSQSLTAMVPTHLQASPTHTQRVKTKLQPQKSLDLENLRSEKIDDSIASPLLDQHTNSAGIAFTSPVSPTSTQKNSSLGISELNDFAPEMEHLDGLSREHDTSNEDILSENHTHSTSQTSNSIYETRITIRANQKQPATRQLSGTSISSISKPTLISGSGILYDEKIGSQIENKPISVLKNREKITPSPMSCSHSINSCTTVISNPSQHLSPNNLSSLSPDGVIHSNLNPIAHVNSLDGDKDSSNNNNNHKLINNINVKLRNNHHNNLNENNTSNTGTLGRSDRSSHKLPEVIHAKDLKDVNKAHSLKSKFSFKLGNFTKNSNSFTFNNSQISSNLDQPSEFDESIQTIELGRVW